MSNTIAQGFFSWVVISEDDKVSSWSKGRSPNLILNQGLDGIAQRTWADSFIACAVGAGSVPPSPAQTGLTFELKRTAVYLQMEGACDSNIIDDNFVIKRTYVFPVESSTVIYREAGFSHSLIAGNNLFSKIALPSIVVNARERLIIQYELFLKVKDKPLISDPIKGVNSNGELKFQKIGLYGVDKNGVSVAFDEANGCNEPSINSKGFLSTNSAPPAILGSCVNRSTVAFEKDLILKNYISGSFSRAKTLSLGVKEAMGSWRSLGIGASPSFNGLIYVSTENFSKGYGYLNVDFVYNWAAVNNNKYSTIFYWQDEKHLFLKHNPLLNYFGLSDE